jgi:hypothetical protein
LGVSFFLLLVNILVFNKRVDVTFQKEKGHWIEAIFAGIVGWVLVLLASYLVFKFVDPSKANFYSIISSFSAANPAFAGSKILNFITVSVLIGFAETNFFARIYEFFADLFKISVSRNNILAFKAVVLIIFLGIIFSIFHATAKGVNATNSLIVVAIMMIISLAMIHYFNGETRQAVLLHIISNGVAGFAVLMQGGTLFG